jgi:hypothetical protein
MGLIRIGPENLRKLSAGNRMIGTLEKQIDYYAKKIRGYAWDELPAQTNSRLSKNRQLHSA